MGGASRFICFYSHKNGRSVQIHKAVFYRGTSFRLADSRSGIVTRKRKPSFIRDGDGSGHLPAVISFLGDTFKLGRAHAFDACSLRDMRYARFFEQKAGKHLSLVSEKEKDDSEEVFCMIKTSEATWLPRFFVKVRSCSELCSLRYHHPNQFPFQSHSTALPCL